MTVRAAYSRATLGAEIEAFGDSVTVWALHPSLPCCWSIFVSKVQAPLTNCQHVLSRVTIRCVVAPVPPFRPRNLGTTGAKVPSLKSPRNCCSTASNTPVNHEGGRCWVPAVTGSNVLPVTGGFRLQGWAHEHSGRRPAKHRRRATAAGCRGSHSAYWSGTISRPHGGGPQRTGRPDGQLG